MIKNFYYDVVEMSDGTNERLKVRSLLVKRRTKNAQNINRQLVTVLNEAQ
jgi:hypothetical protein